MRIAISGKSGCGNSTTSRIVADRLSLRLINFTFRNLAEEKGIEFYELRRMAEEDPAWDLTLDRRQIEMAGEGSCVLGSRLAIWLIPDAELTVYLKASSGERARRILKREGGSLDEVLRETRERDRRDRERYLRLYGIDNDAYFHADLVIDTDRLSPEEVAAIIVDRVKAIPGNRPGRRLIVSRRSVAVPGSSRQNDRFTRRPGSCYTGGIRDQRPYVSELTGVGA